MPRITRIAHAGTTLIAYYDDGSKTQHYHDGRESWTGSDTPNSPDDPTSGGPSDLGSEGSSGGTGITAAMIEAAVNSAGGSLSAMVGSSQEIADSFNAAIAKTMPNVLSSKVRAACLIGECAQESAWFRTTTEYGAGGNRYSPYDGRGFIQLTWENNYRNFGQWCKERGMLSDSTYFVQNPSKLSELQWAPYTALFYFTTNTWNGDNLWEWCDNVSDPWAEISRAINRGNPNATSPAYDEDVRATAIRAVLGVTPDPAPPAPPVTGTAPVNGTGLPAKIAAWARTKENYYYYTQGPERMRLTTQGTDCSGFLRIAFLVNGVKVRFTYTGNMVSEGKLIASGYGAFPPESQMQLGDCVILDSTRTSKSTDHTAMYVGNGQLLSHGGPGDGPDYKTYSTYHRGWGRWQWRRYI